MNRYKLFIPILLLFSLSSVADIEDDISSAQSALSAAESEEIRLLGVLSDVNSEITRVKGEISTANGKVSGVRSDTSSIKNLTTTYNNQASTYRSEASAYRDERDAQNARKAQLTAELEVLLEQNYELQKEIDAENIKIKALNDLYSDLNSINTMVSAASTAFSDAVSRNQTALYRHEGWLNSFHSVSQTYKPDFTAIISADTYKVEHNKIVLFTDSVPSRSSVESEEAVVEMLVKDLLAKVKTLFEFTRELPHKMGIGYLSMNDQNSIRDELYEVDKRLANLYTEGSGLQSSIYKREYKRAYLIDYTIIAWTRLIEETLLAANIQDASGIINSVAYSLNDSVAYSEIRSLLKNKEAAYNTDYRTFYAPLHARRGAISALQVANNLNTNLAAMQISESTRTEIQALITDHISAIDSDLMDINEDLLDRNYHHQRRIGYTENMLSRYQDRMTNTCIEKANTIINGAEADTSHENTFIEFKGSCLK